MKNFLQLTVDVIKEVNHDLSFTLIEVGALKLSNKKEPFYELLDYFPSSKIIGFEIEKELCNKMNSSARNGVKYYPYALGEFTEERNLYITNHPMCSSLYKPNEDFLSLYHNLEVAYLKSKTSINTITLDKFLDDNNIGNIDFIKIDIQGAELDVFKGSKKSLANVLKIICEVEFVEFYENQPLFGDVCKYLSNYNFMFNKFLGVAGRSLKSAVINNNPNFPSQHMWSDAVFVKNIKIIPQLDDQKLLKLCLLSVVYGSLDLANYCLLEYDKRNSSALAKKIFERSKK